MRTTPVAPPTELPDLHQYRFGDTDETPVVARSDGGRGRTIALAAIMVVLVAIAGAVAFLPASLLFGDGDRGAGSIVEPVDDPSVVDDGTEIDPDVTEPASRAAGIEPLDDEPPQSWNVTGVTDGLNVRAAPGVDGELIGTLRADATLIRGTGRRVAVDDREWKQIRFGESVGWVSAAYLAPDLGDGEPVIPASFECYEGVVADARMVLAAEFVGGSRSFVGAMRFDSDDAGIAVAPFRGTYAAPARFVVELSGADQSTWSEVWNFDVDGIVSSNGWRADAIGCNALGASLDDVLAARPVTG